VVLDGGMTQEPVGYAGGRRLGWILHILPGLITLPCLGLFATDPAHIVGEARLFWILGFVLVVLVQVALAVLVFAWAARIRQRGDVAGADGLVRGWMHGVIAFVLTFVVVFAVFAILNAVR
jgi:hypothetical protein